MIPTLQTIFRATQMKWMLWETILAILHASAFALTIE
jgi:hypothetical protein